MVLAGLTYVNVHTTNNPGGEIRGQILAENKPLIKWFKTEIRSPVTGTIAVQYTLPAGGDDVLDPLPAVAGGALRLRQAAGRPADAEQLVRGARRVEQRTQGVE